MAIETSITASILKYLNSYGNCVAEKVKGGAESSGRADINGCFRGVSFRIEVKTPDHRNKPTKKQLYNLYKWHKAGAVIAVTYTKKTVKKLFELDWFTEKGIKIIPEINGCKSLIIFPVPKQAIQKLMGVYYHA